MKIHIDTDIGGDIDDLCALAMVLKWPVAELTGVTTVAEHHGLRAGMVRYVLRLAGRAEVPVAAGAEATRPGYRMFQGLPEEAVYWPEPIVPYGPLPDPPSPHPNPPPNGKPHLGEGRGAAPDANAETQYFASLQGALTGSAADGRGDPAPTEGGQVESNAALDLLEGSIEQGAVIAAIGPYTNLALLEIRSPGILQRARLVLMGGYVFPPRPGYPAWSHEMDWNVQVDVESARLVMERSQPTLVPLAVTVETALRRAYLPRLRQSGPLGALIARQAEAHAIEYKNEETYGKTCPRLPTDIINFQHDPLACAIALGWNEKVEVRELRLKSEIRDGWIRQEIDPDGRPARVVTAVDGERFNEFWLQMVAGNE